MNIFYLDENPVLAAKFHCDKHVVKMIVESAQMLSTAHRVLDGEIYIEKSKSNRSIKRWKLNSELEDKLYKATHVNHPSNVWTRSSVWNYQWLYSLFVNLLEEYTHRYGKHHKCEELIESLKLLPVNIPLTSQTHIPLAMPHQCMIGSGVESYRHYYQTCKQDILVYTNRDKPFWLK